MSLLKIGDKAPKFSLMDHQQKKHSLSDYNGQWLILFFYPKDNTPGCTSEVCHFRDDYEDIISLNTEILGINTDNPASHNRFIEKQKLTFPLLSDESGDICKSYGSLFKLGPIKFCKRHSFIVDPQGKIAKIYRKVDPSSHSSEIADELRMLQTKR